VFRAANNELSGHVVTTTALPPGADVPLTPAGLPLIDPNQTYKTLEDLKYDLLLIGKL